MRRSHFISFLVLFSIALAFLLSSCAGAGSAGSTSGTKLSFNLNTSGRSVSRGVFTEGNPLAVVIGGDYTFSDTVEFDANGKAHVVLEDVPIGATIYAAFAAEHDDGELLRRYLAACPSYTVKASDNVVHISMVDVEESDLTVSTGAYALAIDGSTPVTFSLPVDIPNGISCKWTTRNNEGGYLYVQEPGSASFTVTAQTLYDDGDGSTWDGKVICYWSVGSISGVCSKEGIHISSGS